MRLYDLVFNYVKQLYQIVREHERNFASHRSQTVRRQNIFRYFSLELTSATGNTNHSDVVILPL